MLLRAIMVRLAAEFKGRITGRQKFTCEVPGVGIQPGGPLHAASQRTAPENRSKKEPQCSSFHDALPAAVHGEFPGPDEANEGDIEGLSQFDGKRRGRVAADEDRNVYFGCLDEDL